MHSIEDSSAASYYENDSCNCRDREKDLGPERILDVPEDQVPSSHDDPRYAQSEWDFWHPLSLPPVYRHLGPPTDKDLTKDEKLMKYFQKDLTSTIRSNLVSLRDIHDWFFTIYDPSRVLREHLINYKGDSGQWVLQHMAYSAWKTERSSFLWIYGAPGSGKSITASLIIEDLEKGENYLRNLLYFYFNDSTTQDHMLMSLITQLYNRRTDVRDYLYPLYSSCDNGKKKPYFESLCEAFQSMVQHIGELWVVLDGLDHSPSRDLLRWIEGIRGLQINIHLLVTSRPEQDVKMDIERWACKHDIIPLLDRHTQWELDMRACIQKRFMESQYLRKWDSRIEKEIVTALLENPFDFGCELSGIPWVSPQLDALESCTDYPMVQAILSSLPKTLGEMCAFILANVPQSHQPYTTRILQFVTYASGLLVIEELIDAITVEPTNNPRFDPSKRVLPQDISRFCSRLVKVITTNEAYTNEKITTVRLFDHSIKGYFRSDQIEGYMFNDLQPENANGAIAETCLAYLLDLGHQLPLHDIRQQYPLAKHAARNWAYYASVAKDKIAVQELSAELFLHENAWKTCYGLHNLEIGLGVETSSLAPALYYASQTRLEYPVIMLLRSGADVNAQGGEYGNALQVALVGRHEKIVQILLDNGADVNAQGGEYGTALQTASRGGSEEIVQILLDNGANVNAEGGRFGTALQAATFSGHKRIVQILLDKGADVFARGARRRSALQIASEEGHKDIASLIEEYVWRRPPIDTEI
ncbi:ankyrin repeat-containing domain protein [Daldinia eschscholtzii]|nr:ankyrin repeat-containing domain protein [Daldinia eschscholtzii]